jgi:hypothetical protein
MNRRRLVILVVLIALTGAIAAVLWPESPVVEPTVDDEPTQTQVETDQIESPEPTPRSDDPPVVDETNLRHTTSQLLRFVRAGADRSSPVEVTIGMAGMWPPAEASAPGGGLIPLPRTEVTTLWGDETNSYEVFARSHDRSHGFWGDISIEEPGEPGIHDVVLEPASPLEVTVADESGAPISGAEVRISRGFVALVHLAKETGADGKAVFDGLPSGDFQVTVKAQGYARHLRQVVLAEEEQSIALSLVEGATKIGNGELERLASQVVVSGNRTVVSTGEEDAEGDDGEQEERPRHPLDLYVVDRSGSPVHGALLQLWKDGRRLFEKKSAGTTPVGVEIATPFRGTLVAFDGQRGEGRVDVVLTERANTNEFIVTLDRDLLTLDLPPGRVNARSRIEQILGADLVRDNDAWLADVLSPASAAAKAGIERGDRVVFLQEVSGGYSALIERGSQRMRIQIASKN